MTALSMDILHVTDVQQRKSLMQMLAFLIRKVGFLDRYQKKRCGCGMLLIRGVISSVRW